MKKYIDVEELLEELRIAAEKEGAKANEMAKAGVYDVSVKYGHGECCYIVAQEIVKDIPTADVVEVVHGEWLSKYVGKGHYWECSECVFMLCTMERTNYCPCCGAIMDGKENE